MIESPCKDICTKDPESGLCVGCGRTQEEIANAYDIMRSRDVTYSYSKKLIFNMRFLCQLVQ